MISPVTSGPSESKENVPASVAPVLLKDTQIDMPKQRPDDGTIRKWEILKSIVYGGLAESITSLGVVSSAAGSDATTCTFFLVLFFFFFGSDQYS